MIDQKIAADRLRFILEKRISRALGCKSEDLPRLKLGILVHTAFLILDEECVGGFNATIAGVLELVGSQNLWRDVSEASEEPQPQPEKAKVN